MENYDDIKSKIAELVSKGYQPKEIVEIFDKDIRDKRISKQAIYKYIGEAKSRYISVVLNRYVKETKIPEKSRFVLDFLIKWSEEFQKETSEIIENPNIKRKIIVLEPYLRNLEKVYNLLEKILPREENVARIEQRKVDEIPIRKAEELEDEY